MLDPQDAWPWFEIGDIRSWRDNLDAALAAYQKGKLVAETSGNERDVWQWSVGADRRRAPRATMILEGALKAYEEGLEITRRLMAADPSHAERARDVSVSLERIGDVRSARNDLEGALKAYEEGLEIRRRLMAADPSHAERARDVSVSVTGSATCAARATIWPGR